MNNIDGVIDETKPLRPQLIHHHSVQYESKNIPRPEVQRSNSLPRGLHNAHTVHGSKSNLSPLARVSSRHSIVRQTTFDTDAGSELFKRTPLDLMKQHASLLTNILCLAITLSLVLVTVVQFTGNEERWRQFNLKVDKLSKREPILLDQERNQLSFDEMQAVLYSNQSDLSDGNLTDVGRDVMLNILEMKNWYDKNEKALAKLTTQQQQLIAAKNAVFGIGAERGIQADLNILERDLNNIQDGIQVQLKNLKQKLDKLGSRILDTNNLVTAQISQLSKTKAITSTNTQTIKRNITSLQDDIKKNNETIARVLTNARKHNEFKSDSQKGPYPLVYLCTDSELLLVLALLRVVFQDNGPLLLFSKHFRCYSKGDSNVSDH